MKALNRKDLKDELLKGLDQDYMMSRLAEKLEKKLQVERLLRSKLKEQIGDNILVKFAENLISVLNKEAPLPESLFQELIAQLANDIIYSRIEGLSDALLIEYGDHKDQIGLHKIPKPKKSQGSFNETADVDIENALLIYQESLMEFVNGLSEQINILARRLIKNFAEGIDLLVPKLLDRHKTAFITMVAAKSSLAEELRIEEMNRKIIIEAGKSLQLLLSNNHSINQLVDNALGDQNN